MVLIFPFEYLGQQGVECKKRYYLWVLNTNLDSYEMDIIKDRAKITKRKFVTEKFIKEIARRRQKRLLEKLEK
jgi:glutamate formiminotransferase